LLKGADLESLKGTWLQTATSIAMRNVTNRFSPDSIFNYASIYQLAVEEELNRQLSKYFIVDQVSPGQSPPESMKEILQAKANAVQAAQQAELDRQTAVAQAEQKIAQARGDSAKAVIEASGRAEAIRKEQNAITAEYIDYIKWSNWDGKLPATMLGGNTSVLLQK
jgi:regulator of protease activity HflC (stomatin/prohibitin superfamily)